MAKAGWLAEAAGAAIETALIATRHEILAPLAGTTSRAVVHYLTRRFEAGAREIEREFRVAGVRDGHFHDDDQLAAGAYRYARAVRDQAADENLRLLAQAMAGLARRDTVWVDEFLKFADAISPLSRDEIIYLGILIAGHKEALRIGDPAANGSSIARKNLDAAFPGEDLVQSVGARLQRSGFVIARPVASGIVAYILSPLGKELSGFVNFDRALDPSED